MKTKHLPIIQRALVTGGAGFVGSHLALALKTAYPDAEVAALDNLHRNGSELNLPRLEKGGVKFIKGDVRNPDDLAAFADADLLLECSADPSVLSGSDGDTSYLIQTNLQGALNCAEYCRERSAAMIFLSTSRVYPIKPLLECSMTETETRLVLDDAQAIPGLSKRGVSEAFPLDGPRSLYGGTKLAAEIMLEEYRNAFGLPFVINRCGVLAGPWQFGKADQGIAAFWTAAHHFGKPLKYIGFGGKGKQVRDMLHIDDLARLVLEQAANPADFAEGAFNVGGGLQSSASLLELTRICAKTTGREVPITPEPTTRYADIPIYITDNSKITAKCGWEPAKTVEDIIRDIHQWIINTPGTTELFS